MSTLFIKTSERSLIELFVELQLISILVDWKAYHAQILIEKKPRTIMHNGYRGLDVLLQDSTTVHLLFGNQTVLFWDQTSRGLNFKYVLLFNIELTLAIVSFLMGRRATLLSKTQRRQAIASKSSSSSAS